MKHAREQQVTRRSRLPGRRNRRQSHRVPLRYGQSSAPVTANYSSTPLLGTVGLLQEVLTIWRL